MPDGPIHDKFRVYRTDGQSNTGEKHELCNYFVLDLNCDPHAWPALEAYAVDCKEKYPLLSASITQMIENHYKFQ